LHRDVAVDSDLTDPSEAPYTVRNRSFAMSSPPAATVSLRDRRQITLPAEIVSAAGLSTNDTLEVRLVNGNIVLAPTHAARSAPRSMSRFLGAARGLYGATAEEADAQLRQQRDEW
jgi:bifunctional DNA-binding transcriptional regulator/antitoxin component of YhaV-PrlF toxin-antitoxin module